MRKNKYREKIIKILKSNHLLSVSDVHKSLKDADYSTIYRNLKSMTAEGEITRVILDKDSVKYELKDLNNLHDHFMCNNCGEIEEIHLSQKKIVSFLPGCEIKNLLVRGFCKKCNKK